MENFYNITDISKKLSKLKTESNILIFVFFFYKNTIQYNIIKIDESDELMLVIQTTERCGI